jgi:hypothetical protein
MLGEQIADGTVQIRFFAKTTFIGDRLFRSSDEVPSP